MYYLYILKITSNLTSKIVVNLLEPIGTPELSHLKLSCTEFCDETISVDGNLNTNVLNYVEKWLHIYL